MLFVYVVLEWTKLLLFVYVVLEWTKLLLFVCCFRVSCSFMIVVFISEYYPLHIESLVQQCMEWCDSYNLPILVPLSTWLPDPRVECVLTINTQQAVATVCPTNNGQHIFCASDKSDITMYHVPSNKRLKTISGNLTHEYFGL